MIRWLCTALVLVNVFTSVGVREAYAEDGVTSAALVEQYQQEIQKYKQKMNRLLLTTAGISAVSVGTGFAILLPSLFSPGKRNRVIGASSLLGATGVLLITSVAFAASWQKKIDEAESKIRLRMMPHINKTQSGPSIGAVAQLSLSF